ncbi:MAG: glutamyl-tRNA reductase [Chloroflexota bacterium]
MNLITIGLSYKSTPVALREALALGGEKLDHFLEILRTSNAESTIAEVVALSTCNRLEIYIVAEDDTKAIETIQQTLSQIHDLPLVQFQTHLTFMYNEAVIEHLMKVAAGLDSMVLGEPQILGQLVTAYQTALDQQTAKAILSRLYQAAIHAGKRVRTETAIGRNPASVSSVAVQLARHHLPALSEQVVMVLGAGEMGALTARALVKQGVKRILVVSRSLESAQQLAKTLPHITIQDGSITAHTLAELPNLLLETDAIITSTGATMPVLKQETVRQAQTTRSQRPLLIVDIGLPRDVEPDVGSIKGVHLYDLDHLEDKVADTFKARETEIPQAQQIISEETLGFLGWYRTRKVVPTITRIRHQYEQVKDQEVNRTLNRLQHLDERDQALVAELAHRLTCKFLHHPTVQLKDQVTQDQPAFSPEAVQQLFGLKVETEL